MKAASLRTKILTSLLSIVFFLGISLGLFGYYIVKKYIVGEAQEQVVYDLQTVRKTYQRQHENIKDIFSLFEPDFDLKVIKEKMGLDYIFVVNAEDLSSINSELAKESFNRKSAVSSSRIISEQELKDMGEELCNRALISVKYTPKSRPDTQDFLKSAMSLEAARPFLDQRGEVTKIVYGGKIINNNIALIDEISDTVFKTDPHQPKGSGTVTIFLDGVRIATNVLDNRHQRAVGTVVSEVVYKAVVENSGEWLDRAFVVTDWYLTAYEPIVNLKGEVVGILYVGIPEKPFYDIGRNFFLILVLILAFASLAGIFLSCLLSLAITKPVIEVLRGTERLSYGDTDTALKTDTSIKELNDLAASFNIMAGKLKAREESLEVSNEKLASLNKSYLDLIGFVAHELKGILASAILNVYSVKDGFLGLTNFKQRKALDSVAKNLDYLSQTVKNFLNLSRIEKGELSLNKTKFMLKEDVINEAVEYFAKQYQDKGISLSNNVSSGILISADLDLIKIVFHNLVSNAIKYGTVNGKIEVSSSFKNGMLEVSVYNDGIPLQKEETNRLFKKFTRLMNKDYKKEKGTGLGLFITRQIIKNHGGEIRIEPKDRGNEFIFCIPMEEQ